MNQTVERLQAKYAARFAMTAAALVGATTSIRFIWLGKTGDYLLLTIAVASGCVYGAWIGMRDLHHRWTQLRQLRFMQEHGPYDRPEYVSPQDAARHLGGSDGPNMWA